MSRNMVWGAAIALSVAGSIATAQGSVTNLFTSLNKVIPDGQLTGVSDTEHLVLPDITAIGSLQVTLTISSGYNGDYYAYLVHDGGFSVLLNRTGRANDNPYGYGDAGMDVTFTLTGNDIHNYQDYTLPEGGGPLTGEWAPDGRYINPMTVLDTDTPSSLLGSFNGVDPNGDWTLFLADLDFGDQGTLTKWGLIVTGVPEPSTWSLMLLGGLAFGRQLLKRRRAVS
jgi:subtilisin-like proprotein convertase family protein